MDADRDIQFNQSPTVSEDTSSQQSTSAATVTPVATSQLSTINNSYESCQSSVPISLNDGIPLGANIPLTIKQNIWFDQFIEFRTLLPKHKDHTVSIHIEQNTLSFSNRNDSKAQYHISINQGTPGIFFSIHGHLP